MAGNGSLSEPERERRRLVRISNNFLVRSCKADPFAPGETEKIAGIVRDINIAGLAFLTNEEHQKGDILELEVEFVGLKYVQAPQNGLLNSAVINVLAHAVRVEHFEPGLSLVAAVFEPRDEEDLALVRQAVSYDQSA